MLASFMFRSILYAIKMPLGMELFFRHAEIWYSNNHQLQPVGNVGELTLKKRDIVKV